MTIPVAASEIAATLTRFESATLITHASPYVKLLTVDPTMEGDDVVVHPIRESTQRNVAVDPHVTLVWQQHVHHGWTLIVDGIGRVEGDTLRVRVESGMLHRPRAHADGPAWEGCDAQ